jgi:hypothetical protein
LVELAQNNFDLSGTIRDAATGEELIGATVYIQELERGAITNTYGYYSIGIPAGEYTVIFRFVGYKTEQRIVKHQKNQKINIELSVYEQQLNEVIVHGEHVRSNVQSGQMGVVKMNMKEIESVPVLFGEKDILKTIQLMPGVSAGSEGSSGFYVRGGKSDQNLILLDEAPVYNAAHLLGFFSVFNSDALKDVKLYKAGIPSQFAGRLSSVLDIHTINGNRKEYHATGGIGLISSRIMLEGPIQKDKSSFVLSARRTYADWVYGLVQKDFRGNALYFYDLNTKLNFKLNDNNRIFLSYYNGRDKFALGKMGFSWGNNTATIRWNHVFNPKLFSNTSLIYSDYNYEIGGSFGTTSFVFGSGIRDGHLKQDFTYYLNMNNTLRFGFSTDYHIFYPGKKEVVTEDTITGVLLQKNFAVENGLYISDEQEIGALWKIKYGIRLSNFNQIGPGTVYDFDNLGAIIDSSVYSANEIIKSYMYPEPRFSIRYLLSENSSLKASYHRTAQYIHLLSGTTSDSPTDIWVSSSKNVKPGLSDQYSLGYFQNFRDNTIETSLEVYYKDMFNQIDYKNGADVLFNPLVEGVLTYGKAYSTGIELMLKKKNGKLTGWVSYTLARTLKYFPEIQSSWFSARQNRTHDLAIVVNYHLSRRWTFSGTWVYYTGDAVTMPAGAYAVSGTLVPLYTERNGGRMPDYHRLDIGITLHGKKKKRIQSDWNLSIYNVYARKNAYAISFEENPEKPGTMHAIQTSLFSIIPSISWNFKF